MESNQKDLHKSHAIEYVEKKIRDKGHIRCGKCWMDRASQCICSRLRPIIFHTNFHFVIYMDHKEYMNPGDDAKLLLCTSPSQSSLILYPHEDDKLFDIIRAAGDAGDNICILFPHERALSYEEYSSQHSLSSMSSSKKQIIIVIDGIWRRARKMASHLHELFPHVPHVQLTPDQLSVYARQQSQPDRICTVEALALFLQNFGEDMMICQALIDAVKINNSGLKRKPAAVEI